jgi:hypothetical protein
MSIKLEATQRFESQMRNRDLPELLFYISSVGVWRYASGEKRHFLASFNPIGRLFH